MNLPIAPLGAAVLGGIAALGIGLLPMPLIETGVLQSGLPALLAAAEPPLGFTARAALALGTGALVAGFGWLALMLLLGGRTLAMGRSVARAREDDGVMAPVVRRADAHPDAPPRPPLLATRDLGMPFFESAEDAPRPMGPPPTDLPPPAERPLPLDLDQPLAAFDPAAVPDVPLPSPVLPPPPRAPRPTRFAESERFEIFELTPPVRPAAPARLVEPVAPSPAEASVHALLERLERGVHKQGLAPAPAAAPSSRSERGLEDALATLRNLARAG